MKKTFLFASLLAVVAMFAVSCDKEKKNGGGGIDAPKALFTYTVDGLDVTFENASKNAESYSWDFGDGSALATDENPAHKYEKAGTYVVVLTAKNSAGEDSYSENVVAEVKAWSVKVDGNFDDWKTVPADLLAEAVADEMAVYEALYKIKFVADDKKVYFYMEFSAEEDMVYPIDMMIDTDGSAETGMSTWLWANSGVDILIEGFPYPVDDPEAPTTGYADAGVFKFIGDTPDAWAWDALDIAGAIEASQVVDLGNGSLAFEGSLSRSSIPGMTAFKVGIFTSDVDWVESGALPQMTITEEGNVASEMLEVKLQ